MPGHSRLLAVQINHTNARSVPTHSGLLGLVVVLIGLALACYGAAPIVRFRLWRTQALTAPGHVIDNVPGPLRPGRTSWLPIVEFQAEGAPVMAFIPTAEHTKAWPLGCHVEVLYDPSDPHQVRLANVPPPISASLILGLGIIGVFLATAA